MTATSQSNGASRVEIVIVSTYHYRVKVDGTMLMTAAGSPRRFGTAYAADKAGRAAAAQKDLRTLRPDWTGVTS